MNGSGSDRRPVGWLRWVALCALSALLAACATSQGTSQSGPIKIGSITSLSGAYQTLGTFEKAGTDLAVKQVNDGGGISGRKVEVTYQDDQTKPDQAVIAFNQLAGQKVTAVIGPTLSDSALAVKQGPLDSRKIPTVATAASDQLVDPVDRYLYMTPARASVAAERIVDYYKSQGLTRMGIWYASDNAFASTGYQATKKQAQKQGISFVEDEAFSARDTTDFTPLLTKLRASDAQGLLVWVTGAPAVAITKQFRAQGLSMPLFFSHAEATPLYYGASAAGAGANGVVIPTQLGIIASYLPDGQLKKSATDMITAYQKANGGVSPPQFAFDGWIAMMLLADAMKRKGTGTQQILDGLNSANLTTPQGVYKMTSQDHSGFPVQYMQVAQIQNNAPTPTPYSTDLLRKLS